MSNGRIYYLDALRSFCMLYGILFRSATLSHDAPYPMIEEISGFFRMPAFFLISGFFAAMLIAKRGEKTVVSSRIVVLGVPLIVGLLLLNPATQYLIDVFHNGSSSLELLYNPREWPWIWSLHLWFLFSLIAFFLVAPLLLRVIRTLGLPALVDGLDARLGRLSFLAIAVAAGLFAVASVGVQSYLYKPILGGTPVFELAVATTYYVLFFAIGMLAYHAPAFFERLHTISPVALVIGVGSFLALQVGGLQSFDLLGKVISSFFHGFTTIAIVGLLLSLARKWITGPSHALTVVNGSAYSVYLLHFLVVYAVAVALQPIIANEHLMFVSVVLLTFAITLALHEYVVKRSRLLTFLLNGRQQPPLRATAQA